MIQITTNLQLSFLILTVSTSIQVQLWTVRIKLLCENHWVLSKYVYRGQNQSIAVQVNQAQSNAAKLSQMELNAAKFSQMQPNRN